MNNKTNDKQIVIWTPFNRKIFLCINIFLNTLSKNYAITKIHFK